MVSIIIASTSHDLAEAIEKNIADTIGLPFEIIVVENKCAPRSLCAVYNEAAAVAKYDFVCLMHEDICIHTMNWGAIALGIMDDPEVGVIGVAGGTYKSLTPAGWACPGLEGEGNKVNLIQHYKYTNAAPVLEYYNSNEDKLAKVATVDGVWMFTRKKVIVDFPFDNQLLNGFHGYDIDFCLNVSGQFKVVVTFDILIEHYSEGNYDRAWLEAMLKIHTKHRENLPLNTGDYTLGIRAAGEKQAVKALLKNMSLQKYTVINKLGVLWKSDIYRVLGWPQFLSTCAKIAIGRY